MFCYNESHTTQVCLMFCYNESHTTQVCLMFCYNESLLSMAYVSLMDRTWIGWWKVYFSWIDRTWIGWWKMEPSHCWSHPGRAWLSLHGYFITWLKTIWSDSFSFIAHIRNNLINFIDQFGSLLLENFIYYLILINFLSSFLSIIITNFNG